MTTATKSGPGARKLTDETIAAFSAGVTAGLPLERVCAHLRINDSTWRRWRAQGEADLDAGKPETPCARLCTAVQEARLTAERRAVMALVQAAQGEEQTTTRTTTTTRWLRVQTKDGRWTYEQFTDTTTVTETTYRKDWRAALAWLERTLPQHYSRVVRQFLSGPTEGDPVRIEAAPSLRDKLEADLAKIAEALDAGIDPLGLLPTLEAVTDSDA